jgi:hypothetical protein
MEEYMFGHAVSVPSLGAKEEWNMNLASGWEKDSADRRKRLERVQSLQRLQNEADAAKFNRDYNDKVGRSMGLR